jgi:3-oxoacyl-[acyl-carrier protein] reductase
MKPSYAARAKSRPARARDKSLRAGYPMRAMDLGLAGKTALITASTAGIGLATARSLAREGARVIVNGRSSDTVGTALDALRTELGSADITGLVADSGSRAGCDAIIAAHESVDILVNNTGVFEVSGILDAPDEQWARLLEVNVMSGLRLGRHYLAKMLERGEGRIVFINSNVTIVPAKEMPDYSATKAMQLSVARSLAELTKGTNITVNSVLPGMTKTANLEDTVNTYFTNDGDDFATAEKRFVTSSRPNVLLHRLVRPEEVADTVTFLASPRASATNGSAVRVEGGMLPNVV